MDEKRQIEYYENISMKEKVENIIEQRKHLEERLKAIAEYIDNTQPWKTVLREEFGVII